MPRGPKNTPERMGILAFIDKRIAGFRKRARKHMDDESRAIARALQVLRDDLRQELDRDDEPEKPA